MAVYRSIYTTFWSDSKINDEFSPEDKYFYLYLLTNPFTNICGCYEISIKRMASDLGYDSDTVRKLIKRMSEEHKVISYNESTKEILIINWYRYNWNKSPKLVSGIKEFFPKIKCIEFKKYIADILKSENLIEENDLEDMVSIPYEYPMDTVCIPTVTVSNTNIDNVNNNIINNNVSNVECTLELQEEQDDLESKFQLFWNAYPRHTNTSKKETFRKFCKAMKKTDLQTMLDAIEKQKKTKQWLDERYIPMATTWLNQERWDVEVEIYSKPEETPKKVYSEEDTAWKAANWLSRKINSIYPTIKPLSDEELQVWASVFERMETDGCHPPNEILSLMKYAFQNDFWQTKITSPWDLRRHYVKLLAQAEKDGWFN